MNIILDKKTYVNKEMLVKDDDTKELWNFTGYLFCILDEYYMICFDKMSN